MRVIKRVVASIVVAAAVLAAGTVRDEGIAAFNEGRYSAAIAKLTQAAKDPTDRTARAFLALTEAALGNCQTALPGLLATDRGDGDVYRLTKLAAVKCYNASGDSSHTFLLLDKLQKEFPNDPDVLYTAAKLHMKAFNDTTFAMFQRAPASYRVHELSAEIFEVEDRYSDAIAEYRKAIDLNPNAPELHFRLGRAILLQSHSLEALDQAAAEFHSELKLSPEDGACEFQLGQIAQVQAKTPDAESHFQRALKLSPNFVQALIALGKLKTQDKQYDDAVMLLSHATKLQPTNEAAHYGLLTAYRDSGQMDKAKGEKLILDHLQKPQEGEFSDFLKKLGEKQPEQ
jgi:tetratricopeptide (TPR) repeat protein